MKRAKMGWVWNPSRILVRLGQKASLGWA